MCGLLAGSGKLNPRIITALGCQNESRGDDSAGIGWQEGHKLLIEKVAISPLVAYPHILQDSILQASKSSAMIGHTRQVTTGSVTNDNAHPFILDGIIFAHNGIIQNYEKFGKYAVDSMSLIHGILKKDFSKYEGPIALVWIEAGRLHAYRKGNPLFRGILDGAVYLASERKFLGEVGCKRIKELAEGRVYSFKESQIYQSYEVPTNKLGWWSTDYDSKYQMGYDWEKEIEKEDKKWQKLQEKDKLDKQYKDTLQDEIKDLDNDTPPDDIVVIEEGEEGDIDPDEILARQAGLGYYYKEGKRHYGMVPRPRTDGKLNVGL